MYLIHLLLLVDFELLLYLELDNYKPLLHFIRVHDQLEADVSDGEEGLREARLKLNLMGFTLYGHIRLVVEEGVLYDIGIELGITQELFVSLSL